MTRFFNACLWGSAAALFCLAYGYVIEPTMLKTRYLKIESMDWQNDKLRVAFLADIHIAGVHVPPNRVSKIVSKINAGKPDLVLIGGDFISGHVPRTDTSESFDRRIRQGLQALRSLDARYGVVSVIGNHDVWYDAPFVENQLEEQGITVLGNEGREIDGRFCVLGMADDLTQNPSNIGYKDCPENSDIIALMHSPDSFQLLRSDTDLALAGHTHGGQINLPFIGRRVTSTRAGLKYAYGLVSHNGISAYVTSGIGTSIIPARFRSPPEIVFIDISRHD